MMNEGELIEQRPDWLIVPEEERGISELGQYIVPPRVKVVQPLSQAPYDQFEKGDAILTPQLIRLCGEDESFHVTPFFFFAEWALWNPLETKGMLPAIRERTLDPSDGMVALSRDAKRRQVKCPEMPDTMMRYVEHLNFMCVIKDVAGLEDTPVILTFDRGEHRQGSTFAAIIRMRKVPIWACNFCMTVGQRKGPKGTWWGLTPSNPAVDSDFEPWIEESEAPVFKRLHAEFKEAHANRTIQVDYGEGDDTAPPEGGDTTDKF